eukprot:NODE_24235_length_633_cov_1.687747.p7 GENE.NODE_24235_length_633_cov_1.687747~~NODE_24235_length_633_cov_1.687747.p7  ORF type:complete len:57 (+),score=37.98 NODE_24235_length_633_cov_1.687747:368-538(+)
MVRGGVDPMAPWSVAWENSTRASHPRASARSAWVRLGKKKKKKKKKKKNHKKKKKK